MTTQDQSSLNVDNWPFLIPSDLLRCQHV
jgi:hypothetical protein